MARADLFDKNGKEIRQIELPSNFSEKIRKDIVLKVFEAKKYKHPYSPYIWAGKLHSASGIIGRKRHSWKVSYGRGISRIPRKIMSRDGTNFNWVGATVNSTRGGRRAHPPRAEKNQFRKINKKEYLAALNSSLSATLNKEILESKFNIKIIKKLPIVVASEVLKLKTKDFFELLTKLFGSLNKILKDKTIRAGRGKTRGRKYKSNSGLLFVIGNKEEFAVNGIEIVKVKNLKIENLAPNGNPGRITIYSEESIKDLGEKK
jgi:large subunit ribosomal protein L4e